MFSRKEVLLLGTLAFAKFTHILDFMVMMPLGPQLMTTFGITAQQFGILVSSYTLSAGIFAIIAAFFIDRFDRKKVLLLMYAGFLVGTLACALAGSYWQLMLARTLTGVFGGLLNTLILSIVGDSFELKKRATATGIVMSAMSAAAAFGVPLGVYFAAMFNWQVPFYIVLGLATPIWFGIWQFVPAINSHLQTSSTTAIIDLSEHLVDANNPSPERQSVSNVSSIAQPKRNAWEILTDIFGSFNQIKALSLGFCLVMGQFMIIPFIAPYAVKNLGFAPVELTYIYLFGGAVSLLTGAIFGRLADKFGHKIIFIIAVLGSLLPFYLVTNLSTTSFPIILTCTSLFFIFVGGRAVPSMAMVMSSVPSRYRASFMSFNTAFQQLAAGAAALISGFLIVETPTALSNFNLVGYLAMGLSFVAIGVALWLRTAKE